MSVNLPTAMRDRLYALHLKQVTGPCHCARQVVVCKAPSSLQTHRNRGDG